MEFLEFVRSFGWLFALAVSGVLALIVFAFKRGFATKEEHLELSSRVDVLEDWRGQQPDPHELVERTAALEATVHSGFKAMDGRLGRVERTVCRMESYLLNHGAGDK